jgi:glycosyltransferase involved in cell wall biosynthesis
MKDQLITFIIPTIGRSTLINSINSLKNQTVKDWCVIIIFDGISCNIDIDLDDNRIKVLECEKKGVNINSAGEVRNYGMSFVETKWIAFLDDDDIIDHDYIETFYNEINLCNDLHLDLDLIIFRMNDNGRIIPKLKTDNFYLCDVGISFILKKEIYDEGCKFTPDGAEDFLYLDKIRTLGKRMMISPYVKYYVRKSDFIVNENNNIGNRIFININNNLITMLGYILFFNFSS